MTYDIYKYKHDVEWSLPVMFGQEFIWAAIYKTFMQFNIAPPKVNVFGAPQCDWAGGRIPVVQKPDFNILENIFNNMKLCNATPTITFSYTGITKKNLDDSYCNALLDFALEHNFKFIVYSDLLKDYIKEKSPDAYVIASVIKAVNKFQNADKIANPSPEEETEYYNELLKEYDMVVVRPEYSRTVLLEHPEYIDDISKIEVLINQTCVPNCPLAMSHYNSFEKHREGYDSAVPPFVCIKQGYNNLEKGFKSNLVHTQEQVTKLVNKNGVRHLKLQGRGDERPIFKQRLYEIYTQMFKTDGDGFLMLYYLNSALDNELYHLNMGR